MKGEVFNGATEISKVDFFAVFQTFWDKVFKSHRIAVNSFKKTGLIPLNPLIVLEKMKEYKDLLKQLRTSTPPPRQSSPILPSSLGFATPPSHTPLQADDWTNWPTPLTLHTRNKGVNHIKERIIAAINGTPITPTVVRVQDKVEMASQRSMLSGALAKQRVYDLGLAESIRQKRKEGGGKVVQKYGEIYTYQARRDIEADKEDEQRIVNMRNQRLSKPWRAKYGRIMLNFCRDWSKVTLRVTGANL